MGSRSRSRSGSPLPVLEAREDAARDPRERRRSRSRNPAERAPEYVHYHQGRRHTYDPHAPWTPRQRDDSSQRRRDDWRPHPGGARDDRPGGAFARTGYRRERPYDRRERPYNQDPAPAASAFAPRDQGRITAPTNWMSYIEVGQQPYIYADDVEVLPTTHNHVNRHGKVVTMQNELDLGEPHEWNDDGYVIAEDRRHQTSLLASWDQLNVRLDKMKVMCTKFPPGGCGTRATYEDIHKHVESGSVGADLAVKQHGVVRHMVRLRLDSGRGMYNGQQLQCYFCRAYVTKELDYGSPGWDQALKTIGYLLKHECRRTTPNGCDSQPYGPCMAGQTGDFVRFQMPWKSPCPGQQTWGHDNLLRSPREAPRDWMRKKMHSVKPVRRPPSAVPEPEVRQEVSAPQVRRGRSPERRTAGNRASTVPTKPRVRLQPAKASPVVKLEPAPVRPVSKRSLQDEPLSGAVREWIGQSKPKGSAPAPPASKKADHSPKQWTEEVDAPRVAAPADTSAEFQDGDPFDEIPERTRPAWPDSFDEMLERPRDAWPGSSWEDEEPEDDFLIRPRDTGWEAASPWYKSKQSTWVTPAPAQVEPPVPQVQGVGWPTAPTPEPLPVNLRPPQPAGDSYWDEPRRCWVKCGWPAPPPPEEEVPAVKQEAGTWYKDATLDNVQRSRYERQTPVDAWGSPEEGSAPPAARRSRSAGPIRYSKELTEKQREMWRKAERVMNEEVGSKALYGLHSNIPLWWAKHNREAYEMLHGWLTDGTKRVYNMSLPLRRAIWHIRLSEIMKQAIFDKRSARNAEMLDASFTPVITRDLRYYDLTVFGNNGFQTPESSKKVYLQVVHKTLCPGQTDEWACHMSQEGKEAYLKDERLIAGVGCLDRFLAYYSKERAIEELGPEMTVINEQVEKLSAALGRAKISHTVRPLFKVMDDDAPQGRWMLFVEFHVDQQAKHLDGGEGEYRSDAGKAIMFHCSGMSPDMAGQLFAGGCQWLAGGGATNGWDRPPNGLMTDGHFANLINKMQQQMVTRGIADEFDRKDYAIHGVVAGDHPRMMGIPSGAAYGSRWGLHIAYCATPDEHHTKPNTKRYRNHADFIDKLVNGGESFDEFGDPMFGVNAHYTREPRVPMMRWKDGTKMEQMAALPAHTVVLGFCCNAEPASLAAITIGVNRMVKIINDDIAQKHDLHPYSLQRCWRKYPSGQSTETPDDQAAP